MLRSLVLLIVNNSLKDVAAATFMAIATTTPELFTNLISTFITDSDMGLGTILGSMLFNTLGVAAVAGLASINHVKLDWFPLTRDSIIFSINLAVLVSIAWDGYIMWYEATLLFVMFILYFILVITNHRWERFFRDFIESRFSWCRPVQEGRCQWYVIVISTPTEIYLSSFMNIYR